LEEVAGARADLRGSHLITLAPQRSESSPALVGLFQPVFSLVEGFQWLPKVDLAEALMREDAADRLIGGALHAPYEAS
jgi:hypothetical protein